MVKLYPSKHATSETKKEAKIHRKQFNQWLKQTCNIRNPKKRWNHLYPSKHATSKTKKQLESFEGSATTGKTVSKQTWNIQNQKKGSWNHSKATQPMVKVHPGRHRPKIKDPLAETPPEKTRKKAAKASYGALEKSTNVLSRLASSTQRYLTQILNPSAGFLNHIKSSQERPKKKGSTTQLEIPNSLVHVHARIFPFPFHVLFFFFLSFLPSFLPCLLACLLAFFLSSSFSSHFSPSAWTYTIRP